VTLEAHKQPYVAIQVPPTAFVCVPSVGAKSAMTSLVGLLKSALGIYSSKENGAAHHNLAILVPPTAFVYLPSVGAKSVMTSLVGLLKSALGIYSSKEKVPHTVI
jgi:hypothetical protein